jgi:hypothetical protein
MKQRISTLIWLSLFGVAVLAIIIGEISGSIQGDAIYRVLQNHSRVTRIEMQIISGNRSLDGKDIILQNDTILEKINQTFKYFKEFSPDRENIHSTLIRTYIYKGEKINIQLVNTAYSGWVIQIMENQYKNDSLIRVLRQYEQIE